MRAARRLYEEKGIDNTAFSDIARSAGVSRSTV
ncbi:MAG: helix-turn-helix domain-containing protein, partial [Anaerovoracaceae bacterium]